MGYRLVACPVHGRDILRVLFVLYNYTCICVVCTVYYVLHICGLPCPEEGTHLGYCLCCITIHVYVLFVLYTMGYISVPCPVQRMGHT